MGELLIGLGLTFWFACGILGWFQLVKEFGFTSNDIPLILIALIIGPFTLIINALD